MRLRKIDILRGLALIGMIIYHLSWDLSYFNYLPSDTPTSGGLRILARIVAASFLFLSGFSLVLANHEHIYVRKVIKRFSVIITAALLVSIATYFFMPQDFVYFGILHHIALTGLLGLLFLRIPNALVFASAIAAFLLPYYFSHPFFNTPLLWWTGLALNPRESFDFVPLFPWFSADLAGIFVARLLKHYDKLKYLEKPCINIRISSLIEWSGKHSLVIYLIHQPILIVILWGVSLIIPPSLHVLEGELIKTSKQLCKNTTDPEYCVAIDRCTIDTLKKNGRLRIFITGEIPRGSQELDAITMKCMEQQTEIKSDEN